MSIKIIFFLTCVTINSAALTAFNYKLPTTVFPTKYHLHINTLIHQNITKYNGTVSIDLTIRKPTNEIILNADRLQVFNITLVNLDSGLKLESSQLEHEIDSQLQTLRIFWQLWPLRMQIGQQYRLTIDFVGNIQTNSFLGFKQSRYLDDFNNSVPIATTQFEPNSARLAFPCFDELALKAKFVISITHGANYSAISNMPVDGEPIPSLTSNGPMLTTKFLETPKMSTYLVAFAVTNYQKTSITANGIEHRFFYPPNSKNNGTLALHNAIRTLGEFEKLLGLKYPLPKLDHFGIEKCFGRAMENWGLISYQHKDILSNDKEYNKLQLFDLINVQSHEIAHQWFGNLVTPASYEYVWLKEGLSSYFSFVAADLVYPDEKVMDYFIISEIDYFTNIFAGHPMTHKADDVLKVLDQVAYKLGGSLMRMFNHAIGQSTFIKGMHKFLYIFQYSIADEDDLFAAIQAAVDEDNNQLFQGNQSVANVMRTWTHNIGTPTITVTRNYDTGTITISQKPYIEWESNQKPNQKWWIPMSFATASSPDFERTTADYIMPPEAKVTIDLKDFNISLSNADWLIVNKQQTGLFNIIYDDLNLKLIGDALFTNKNTIHYLNRALIFRDLSQTYTDNLDAIEPILRILQYLKFEDESLPWFYALTFLSLLIEELKNSKISDEFNNFVDDKFVDIYEQKYTQDSMIKTAIDLKTQIRTKQFNFHTDTRRMCRNITTSESMIEYFGIDGNVGNKTTACHLSLCEAMKNATLEEYKQLFTRIVELWTYSAEYYEFLIIMDCVKSTEIFNFLMDMKQNDSNLKLKQLSLEILKNFEFSNKYFRKWMTEIRLEDKEEVVQEDVVVVKDEERKFLRKYEKNIKAWLDALKSNSQAATENFVGGDAVD